MGMKIEDVPAWAKNTLGLVAVTFSVFFFMDQRHASQFTVEKLRADTLLKDLRSQHRDITNTLDTDAKALAFYRNIQRERPLIDSEVERFEYLEKIVPTQQTRALELEKEVRAQEKAVEGIKW